MTPPTTLYAIGLGSNRWHGRHGRPKATVAAAARELDALGRLVALSSILPSAPIGPSTRRYANAAALLESALQPPALLTALKAIERRYGRRAGRRWGPRVIDLDILLWSRGIWRGAGLTIPHPELGRRAFVLAPLSAIAPGWRLPGSAVAVRHLAARLTKSVAVHRDRSRSGP